MITLNEQSKIINISGEEKTWDRARLITIDNTYGKNPKITIIDDRITVGPLGEKHKGLPVLTKELTGENYTTTFDLLNPYTNEKFGEMSYQDIQVTLYSLYVHLKNQQ